MKSYTDEDLFGDTQRYDAVLSPISKALATRTARDLARGTYSPLKPSTAPTGLRSDTLDQLYEVAQELRDRLRFSELRLKQLKAELREARADAAAERKAAATKLARAEQTLEDERADAESQLHHVMAEAEEKLQHERSQALSALGALEDEVQQLSAAVKTQSSQLDAMEQDNKELRERAAYHQQQNKEQAAQHEAEVRLMGERHDRQLQEEAAQHLRQQEEATRQLARAVGQAHEATLQAEAAVQSRGALAQQVSELRLALDEAHTKLSDQDARQQQTSGALLDAKTQMAEASQVAALYQAAKEELERLDKENTELKEMVQGESFALARSRILDSVGAQGQRQHNKSTPLFLTPEAIGKRSGSARRRRSRSLSPGRLGLGAAVYPPPFMSLPEFTEAAQLASLAFLGPPSSAYHTDPDKFVFVRVAGGFSPKYVGQEPLPRASGWLPKAVVRLVQAFRHSYGLAGDPAVPWMCWEPLLLMVDEVYRRVAAAGDAGGSAPPLTFPLPTPGILGHPGAVVPTRLTPASAGWPGGSASTAAAAALAARATVRDQRQRSPVRDPEGVASVATYPRVIQAERILHLSKQLARASKKSGRSGRTPRRRRGARDDDYADVGDHVLVGRLAEKDYHAANQLAEAEHENMVLRKKYSLVSGGAGDYRDRAVGDQLLSDADRERRRLNETMVLLNGELRG